MLPTFGLYKLNALLLHNHSQVSESLLIGCLLSLAICTSFFALLMHLSLASPREGGGPRADVGTLLIVHFKVLVFPHPLGIFFLQSPQYLAKPSTQLDLKMHFRTLFWFLEQSANAWTLHSDEN